MESHVAARTPLAADLHDLNASIYRVRPSANSKGPHFLFLMINSCHAD